MSSDRREFLQRLTVGSVAFGALPATLSAAELHSATTSSTTAFQEFLEAEQQAAVTYDVSWTQKLTGKYRAVFDVPALEGGAGVWRAGMWVNHYRDVLKAQPSDLNPVIVIRHSAIPYIMNHEFWDRFDVAKESKVRHPMTDKKTRRNPVLMNVAEDKLPPSFAAYNLQTQIERGAIVLACNIAFGGMVSLLANKEKLNFGEARTKALTMMVPGIILQPNGIFGVTLAQQNGCSFVQAT